MRISRAVLAGLLVVGVAVGLAASGASAKDGVKYASPRDAFEQGLGAYKSGYYEIAIPALTEAMAKGDETDKFFARFYLARIYSDNGGARTNHGKAYQLFQKLADEHFDVDPDDGQRAPFVAKALTALAGYLRSGIREIGLRPDPDRAVEYLQHAATFFNDKDAQFELAKSYVGTNGDREDVKRGLHYLSVLTEEGHPGAQAYLADLLWRGRFVPKDERRALALIRMAVEHAPPSERVWIEDIYQNIFCSASQGTRKQADGIVATWRKVFPRPAPPTPDQAADGKVGPQRLCQSGEVVSIEREAPPKVPPPAAMPPTRTNDGTVPPAALQGTTTGFGFRDIGATK
jgi:uncharacterized protein